MREAGYVLLLLLVLGMAVATAAIPWFPIVETGQQLMLGAATVGIPLELVYFALLAVALGHNGQRPAGWYWRSFDHHHLLSPRQRRWVLPWFVAGALAFTAIALGIGITLLGLVAAVRQNF